MILIDQLYWIAAGMLVAICSLYAFMIHKAHKELSEDREREQPCPICTYYGCKQEEGVCWEACDEE